MSDDIFDRLKERDKRSLFKNERIFTEDYEPKSRKEVKHRDAQMDEVAECIYDTTKRIISDLFVYGVAGVGKTYTVSAVLNDASKILEKQFQCAWLNCKNISPLTDFQVMNEICEQLGCPFDKGGKGHPTRDIEEVVIARHEGIPLLIVFDEADALLKGKNTERLLYTFYDRGISDILLSNDFRWTENADDRIRSRAKNHSITFGVYSSDQLREILWFLALEGLNEGVVNDEILARIAQYTTDTFLGDVRKAKILMRASVQLAMDERVKAVTNEHLEKAIPEVEPTKLVNDLRHFSLQEHCALGGFVIQRIHSGKEHGKAKEASTTNIHYFYGQVAKLNDLNPVSSTRMKGFLGRLVLSKILEEPQLKTFGMRGKTNVYYSRHSIDELGKALEELKIFGLGDGSLVSIGFFSSKRMLGLNEEEEKWNEQALKKLEEINRKKGISKNLPLSMKGFLAEE